MGLLKSYRQQQKLAVTLNSGMQAVPTFGNLSLECTIVHTKKTSWFPRGSPQSATVSLTPPLSGANNPDYVSLMITKSKCNECVFTFTVLCDKAL